MKIEELLWGKTKAEGGFLVYRKCPHCRRKIIAIIYDNSTHTYCPYCKSPIVLSEEDWGFSVIKNARAYNLFVHIPDFSRPPSKKNAYRVIYQPKLQRCLLYLKREVKQFEAKLASLIDKTRPLTTPWNEECSLRVIYYPCDFRGDTLNIGGVIGDALEKGNLIKRDALITKFIIMRSDKKTSFNLNLTVTWRDYEEFGVT